MTGLRCDRRNRTGHCKPSALKDHKPCNRQRQAQNDHAVAGKDVFVHISAVERAGLSTLNEGAHVSFDIVSNRGKESAENLKVK
jgi:cold shock CspA family protein